MNILFFDTETTGVPRNYKAPITDVENWPRLVQLGFIFHYDDGIISKNEFIIKPTNFVISELVSRIHGITLEKSLSDGYALDDILNYFETILLESADLLVGHNLSYDINVLGAEFFRKSGRNPLEGKQTYDTMLKSTNLCKLPGGRIGYKWPKLHELYFHLFQQSLAQSHTALDDIENTAKCYFELVRLGIT